MVFLQECWAPTKSTRCAFNWPKTPQYEFLADSIWTDFAYGRNAVYPDGDHGNALLSKFPIIRYENLDISIAGPERRGLLHSVLQVPGHEEFHAICVHLGLRESHRAQQLELLCNLLDSLPQGAPVVVAGDFNDWRLRATHPGPLRRPARSVRRRPWPGGQDLPARWPMLRLDRIYVRNATSQAANTW